jgi:hypothetical protein
MEMLVLIVGALVIAAVVSGTVTKIKWGINIHLPKTCPVCATPFAEFLRRPANLAESRWGGNTSGKCGHASTNGDAGSAAVSRVRPADQ